jgi:hypothetical protein
MSVVSSYLQREMSVVSTHVDVSDDNIEIHRRTLDADAAILLSRGWLLG